MCGIVGYVGPQPAAPIVLQGLRALEYRGYDSAGIAVMNGAAQIQVRRAAGKLNNLAEVLAQVPVVGATGVGHTRWATHGAPVERNAHPHCSPDGAFAVVQNGIVENFVALRDRLRGLGYEFVSDTDTEIIVHLVHYHYRNGSQGDLVGAVRRALLELQGPSAVVVLAQEHPGCLVAARLGNAGGVTIGLGDDEMFVASDIPAILGHTRRMVFLDNGELALITRAGATFSTLAGATIHKPVVAIDWNPMAAE